MASSGKSAPIASSSKAQKSLQEWSDAGRKHSNTLFSAGGLMQCRRVQEGGVACIEKEDARVRVAPLHGGFAQYDPDHMCHPCAAYWYAERSAQTLHDMNCHALHAEADARYAGKKK